jgi:hypothetical protein
MKTILKNQFPRRNTGYALDLLADSKPFGDFEQKFISVN